MQVSLWDSNKPSQELDQHQGLPKPTAMCVLHCPCWGEQKALKGSKLEGITPAKIRSAEGLAWPAFVVQVRVDLLE